MICICKLLAILNETTKKELKDSSNLSVSIILISETTKKELKDSRGDDKEWVDILRNN